MYVNEIVLFNFILQLLDYCTNYVLILIIPCFMGQTKFYQLKLFCQYLRKLTKLNGLEKMRLLVK